MKLLKEQELVWTSTVANNRMNRERNASGINSYEQEIKFKPENYLKNFILKHGQVAWLDLCCGQAKALIQSARWLQQHNLETKAYLLGLDLVDQFAPFSKDLQTLQLLVQPIHEWKANRSYDLITCIHGLHYLGDKLTVLKIALHALSPNGLFVANFDANSLFIDNKSSVQKLKKLFKAFDVDYNHRTKMIRCEGPRQLEYDWKYLGANHLSGPNYTGQPAVDSYYNM